ncbi:MAG: sugar transferase [Planctomycetota bacterium]|jgi:lipopolysaccharide/colanic/teichoic acid biosynthesis glycosyltransferase
MNLIIIHKSKDVKNSNGGELLRFAVSSELMGDICLDGLGEYMSLDTGNNTIIAAPQGWNVGQHTAATKTIAYRDDVPLSLELIRKIKRNPWLIVSNGRFATKMDEELIFKVLAGIRADVVAVNVEPELLGRQEKVRLTPQGRVVGFSRLYSDFAEPTPIPDDWPHHIFIKTSLLDKVAPDHTLPQLFSDFIKMCRSNDLNLCVMNVGGIALDLETSEGLLSFCQTTLSKSRKAKVGIQNSNGISPEARLIGKVLLGKNVHIDPKAVVIGPTIISNDVKIGSSAVINSSVIGPGVRVPPNQLVQNCIIKGPQCNWNRMTRCKSNIAKQIGPLCDWSPKNRNYDTYRKWPRLSYAGCFKRMADIFAAVIVLVLFAPIFPLIALIIKFASRGPVFFKDTRQGLHGKMFKCLKFRTMIVGADKIQDKLRAVSLVDGPQFKMDYDPRISAVGTFLRNTYIDEITQFFNVLVGQMSVVGPRPSPEAENTLCPSWRDARLSVRPGLTGLWQVCRTRQPMKDFQEWIHYDTKYVRELSLKMDLWICWRTIRKLVRNFVKQF